MMQLQAQTISAARRIHAHAHSFVDAGAARVL